MRHDELIGFRDEQWSAVEYGVHCSNHGRGQEIHLIEQKRTATLHRIDQRSVDELSRCASSAVVDKNDTANEITELHATVAGDAEEAFLKAVASLLKERALSASSGAIQQQIAAC